MLAVLFLLKKTKNKLIIARFKKKPEIMNPFMRSGLSNGFTLVELIATIALLGILAVVAAPRFFNRDAFDVRAAGDQAQSIVRYAQKLAIAQHRSIFVNLNGGISICYDAACNAPVSLSGKLAKVGATSGISMVVTPNVTGFYFDALGRPFNTSSSASLPRTTIALNGAGENHQILVEAETGYVH